MKHFISQNGTIYGIDKDQDFLIQDDWVELSDEELAERLKPTPEQIEESERAEAKAARLSAMLSGVPYPLDGVEYQISFTSDDGNAL